MRRKIVFDEQTRRFGIDAIKDSFAHPNSKGMRSNPSKEIELSFKGVKSIDDAKTLIAKKFGLEQDFTLDALYDALTSIGRGTRIILSYWHRRGEYLDKVCKVIDDAAKANGKLEIWKSK